MEKIEHPLGPYLQPARRFIHVQLSKLPIWLSDFLMFGLKMAWSCLFAAIMLVLIIVTHLIWDAKFSIARYDFLFVAAILIQILMLVTKLESFEEVKVITLYHIVGTIMEIFKTHVGSWEYPEANLIRIGGVPLFTGFMYGTIGSFMARSIRIFDMRFVHFPKNWHCYFLSVAIYVNFFTHHYIWDFRNIIFLGLAVIYWKTNIHFKPQNKFYSMPLLLAAFLSAFFLWIAENIGTYTKTWLYPGQSENGWHLVSIQKMGAWFMLLFISFTLVTLVIKPKPMPLDS